MAVAAQGRREVIDDDEEDVRRRSLECAAENEE
jgi:hypothetical protein